MTAQQLPGAQKRNRRLSGVLCLMVFGMVGLSYLSVPLYELFCQVTGWSGTPERYSAENREADFRDLPIVQREFRVRFDANTGAEIPWDFSPREPAMDIEAGQQYLAFYRAVNLSDRPTTGTATFNVTPLKLGQYFVKIDCFCFTEQTLAPGQGVEMPVSFYIDPAIDDDPNLTDVKNITLSYTFFPSRDE